MFLIIILFLFLLGIIFAFIIVYIFLFLKKKPLASGRSPGQLLQNIALVCCFIFWEDRQHPCPLKEESL